MKNHFLLVCLLALQPVAHAQQKPVSTSITAMPGNDAAATICDGFAKIEKMLEGDFNMFKGTLDPDYNMYTTSFQIMHADDIYVDSPEDQMSQAIWIFEDVDYAALLAELKTCKRSRVWTVSESAEGYTLSSPDLDVTKKGFEIILSPYHNKQTNLNGANLIVTYYY